MQHIKLNVKTLNKNKAPIIIEGIPITFFK
jgi:hypothetical protein